MTAPGICTGKLGFTEMGCIPKAFCLKDGTYRDEVQMVKFLTD